MKRQVNKMEWKDIIGKTVYHKTFGEGKITYCDKIRITVRFSVGEKKFFFQMLLSMDTCLNGKIKNFLNNNVRKRNNKDRKKK